MTDDPKKSRHEQRREEIGFLGAAAALGVPGAAALARHVFSQEASDQAAWEEHQEESPIVPAGPVRVLAGGCRSGKSNASIDWLYEKFPTRAIIVPTMAMADHLCREMSLRSQMRVGGPVTYVPTSAKMAAMHHVFSRHVFEHVVSGYSGLDYRAITEVCLEEYELWEGTPRYWRTVLPNARISVITLAGTIGKDFIVETNY